MTLKVSLNVLWCEHIVRDFRSKGRENEHERSRLKFRVRTFLQAAVRTRVFILDGLESAQLFPSELGV